MSTTETWTPRPARGYSWPAFTPGHTVSRRHGIWSQRTWEPLAEDLAGGLLEDKPDLVSYPELLAAWARAEARCILLAEYLVGRFADGDEKSEKVLRFVAQFERLAHDLRRELGLTPGSEAELARSRADALKGEFDLEALMARGREARLAAEQRHALETSTADSGGEDPAPGAVGDAGEADGGEGPVDGALPATNPRA
ncbi:MAG TPA: hypothetical protein VK988_08710 [Acidimicrobiales bacterium]|nr:hypothetical protein [Acidimicrobiales bacterium]